MIKTFKSNKFISILLVIMCIILMFNPTIYAKSCLNAISVWAFKVLPVMFPFFVFTRLIVNLSQSKENFMDRLFKKIYNTPVGSFSTFFLSVLSGYPMGAKLICTKYENKQISQNEAKKMLSFCSISGPMFIIGTVGVGMLFSFKSGVIILIANILASLVNGLIYRGKREDFEVKNIYQSQIKSNLLADCVYDSLISILMVGCYIALSFIIIDILKNLGVINILSNAICNIFKIPHLKNVVESVIYGFFEITRGALNLSACPISLSAKTIISSGLIGFGGISIMLQSLGFLNKLDISPKSMFLQKTTQAILCLIITATLCLFFLT